MLLSLQTQLHTNNPFSPTASSPAQRVSPDKQADADINAKKFNGTSAYLTLSDIPDEVLEKILEFHFLSRDKYLHRIRLVNTRLAALALPYTLQTTSVSSKNALFELIADSQSPLYHEPLGKHVRCFELAIIPENIELLGVDNRISRSFPNLYIIRFKFTLGVSVKSGQFEASLSEDTLFRATQLNFNTSWQRFLSQLRPKKFEWTSSERNDFHFVGVYPMLRSLFCSWTLSSIHLDGICLVEQPDLITWSISLPAERVYIRGPFANADSITSAGLQNMKDSMHCRLLLLEESLPPDKSSRDCVLGEVPILTYGNTLVTVKHWSRHSRRNLIALFTEPSPKYRKNENESLKSAGLIKFSLANCAFGFLIGMLFCLLLCVWYSFGRPETWMNQPNDQLYLPNERSCLIDKHFLDVFSVWNLDRSLMLRPT